MLFSKKMILRKKYDFLKKNWVFPDTISILVKGNQQRLQTADMDLVSWVWLHLYVTILLRSYNSFSQAEKQSQLLPAP